jgi:hypothetical protein
VVILPPSWKPARSKKPATRRKTPGRSSQS